MKGIVRLLGIITIIGCMMPGCIEPETAKDVSCAHSWDWIITKHPTSTEEGIETYKCLHCEQGGTTRPVPTAVNVISVVSISITAPVNGAAPNNSAATTDSGYTLGTVSWTPADYPFLGGKVYTANISLTANNGYTFTGLNSANVNGQTGTIINNTGISASISYTFPMTPVKTVSGILIKTQPDNLKYTHNDPLDLAGLVVTLIYDDTTTEDVSAANFSGKNINANPAHGNILNLDVYNGQPVIITYGNFSKNTSNLTVNNKEIVNVEVNITSPVKNAVPASAASGTGDYSIGTVSWSPAHNKFLGGEIYTAAVTLTANSGFIFTGLTSATINGKINPITNNTGNTITLSHTFSRTDERTVYGLTIKSQPSRLTYEHGEHLNLTGLIVTLWFDDDTTEDVAAADFDIKNINAVPADGNTLVRASHNGKPVVITYGELKARTSNLAVNPKVITFSVDSIPAVTYTGTANTPAVVAKDSGLLLTSGADYTVGYANNINAGTATVTVTGVGNYAGSSGNSTFTINKAAGIFGTPSSISTTYTPALTLANLTLSTGYVWNESSTILNAGNSQLFPATYTNPNGNYTSAGGNITVNVAKAEGTIVSAPTLASRTNNGITINAVTAPGNGQTVEYARSTSSTVPSTGWQTGLTFDGLSAGSTHYIFSRSASNDNYNAGTAVSTVITTYFQQDLTITFIQITDAAPLIVNQTISRTGANKTVTLTVSNPTQYSSIEWRVTGTNVSGNGTSFTLDSSNPAYNRVGEHFLTIEVWKDGKPYNKTIIFTVTP